MSVRRTMGLFGATGVGVGAIVGGGILALAGVAYAATGPSAIIAFGLNGVIAILTALSFAEMATRFPESGGTYTFARKVLTVEAAFSVGWVVWFASIVAAVLYAVGFAAFGVLIVERVWSAIAGDVPGWVTGRWGVALLAFIATVGYMLALCRKSGGGGPWINILKVVVFGVLIAGGLWMLPKQPEGAVSERLSPFFSEGALGLIKAMGFTFIALQGFDLIAAVGGEVKEPQKNLPRAMLLSLGIALLIYLPMLFIVAVVGVGGGTSIGQMSAENPDTVVAIAAENFLGGFGYWLVVVAAVLSMLSALQANLLAASRVSFAMARDRTLPHPLQRMHEQRGTPYMAVITTAAIVILIIIALSNVAAAGAASSLIFLVTFALAHGISILARRRGRARPGVFRTPLFPLVPVVGGSACMALAIFQAFAVPSAGVIAAVWLAIGGLLFLSLFARRARVVDASSQAMDPSLVRLRGRSPLVLVPIANPSNAESMVQVASALAPPDVGRVLLLCVVPAPSGWDDESTPRALTNAQAVLKEALTASFPSGLSPDALTTIAAEPWAEIARIARVHGCESMLLGLSKLDEEVGGASMEKFIGATECDVVVLRSLPGWKLEDVERVIVPIGGRGGHDQLRARLLGSLHRLGTRTITFVRILPENASDEDVARAKRDLYRVAMDESPGQSNIDVIRGNDVIQAVHKYTQDDDLIVMGMQRVARRRSAFGTIALGLARRSPNPLILISRQ